MDIFEAIRHRRSIRKFTAQVPPKDTLCKLIEYATLAANAMNRQDWYFTVVMSKQIQKKIYDVVQAKWQNLCADKKGVLYDSIKLYINNFTSFIEAPIIIAVDTRQMPGFLKKLMPENGEKIMGSYASACMAVQNLLLAAYAMGLGTCVYTGCDVAGEEIAAMLEIPKQREVVCLVAVGYAGETPNMPTRKEVDKVVKIVE